VRAGRAEIVIVLVLGSPLVSLSHLKPLDKQTFSPHLPPPLALGVLPDEGSLTMSSQLLEEASKIIPNTALLVNLVSKRVRQLTMGHRPLVEVGPRMSNADVALKEIIDGKLTYEFQPEPVAKV
jgi:DNA-directed RNA polymerase subunit omega